MEIQVMQKAIKLGLKVRVIGVAQNARTKQPESVTGEVTKVGQTVFYVGSKRYRPYFNMTQVVVAR